MLYRQQLILRGDPAPEDDAFLGRLMGAIERLRGQGLELDFESEEEEADGTLQMLWTEPEEEFLQLALIKDRETGICYTHIEAPRRAQLRQIHRVLDAALGVYTLDELQTEASSGVLRAPQRLVRLGLGVAEQPPDATTIRLLREALDHLHPGVRRNAALAMGLTRWPVFVDDLERRLKGEPDERVAEVARRALLTCQRVADRLQAR